MTRQEANKEILRILHFAPCEENLRKADVRTSSSEFIPYESTIEEYIKNYPDLRWCQIMWNIGINLGIYKSGDRFYEESIETLNRLKE